MLRDARFVGFAFVLVMDAAGCAAGSHGTTASGGSSSNGGATSGTTSGGPVTGTSGTMTSAASFMQGATSTSSGTMGPPPTLYLHTNSSLYSMDITNLSAPPKLLGDFDCIGGSGQASSMTDLAVAHDGSLWANSTNEVYSIVVQGSVAHCAQTIPLNNATSVKFYGLTFAPAGVIDPSKEVLIAANTDGQLWAIDATGALTQHGTFGNVPANDGHGNNYPAANVGKPWELSGDIVFLANNGSPVGFATVRDCPSPPSTNNCNKSDTLIEINVSALMSPGTASVTKAVRGLVTGYGAMYGVAAYEDKVYGFSHTGQIVEISNIDGTATLIQSTPNLLWAGAAITTAAAVIPPPPPM